ncbi:MAG: flagellar biosynthesis protein FlhF [Spirochaetaceae bacterium]
MQYFTEQAHTHREAIQKIRSKYGERAKVLTHRTIRLGGVFGLFTKEGVELSGYLSPEEYGKQKSRPPEKTQDRPQEKAQEDKVQEEKKKILESVRGDSTLQQVLEEVQSLKKHMETQQETVLQRQEHPAFENIENLLSENDFSHGFISMIIKKMRSELSLDVLEDEEYVQEKVLEWISENIPLYENDNNNKKKKKILILVGPTGVGKTTTIAKLAAIHSIGAKGEQAKDVRIITIDNYRIGARQQMKTYADILEVPFAGVENSEDLKNKIALYKDADLILVDTIGKSPKDYMNLAKMREVLEACGGKAEIHLALSSTTKASDIKEVLQQFEPFGYSSVVLTKLDETMRVGNVISVLWERGKSVSYITNGQGVPDDIERAGVVRFLKTLEGFSLSPETLRNKFENMYASTPADGTAAERGDNNEGITEYEHRYLYSYGGHNSSETTWGKK